MDEVGIQEIKGQTRGPPQVSLDLALLLYIIRSKGMRKCKNVISDCGIYTHKNEIQGFLSNFCQNHVSGIYLSRIRLE